MSFMIQRWMARKPSSDKTVAIVRRSLLALCSLGQCWLGPCLLAPCWLGCRSEKPLTSEADSAEPVVAARASVAVRTPAPAPPPPPSPPPRPACPRYQAPASHGSLREARLTEISGLGVSSATELSFWVHNDSGDHARAYLLSAHAEWLATYRLLGVDHPYDLEDLAAVRHGSQMTLYLGDIGDNQHSRTDGVLIHRLAEPDLPKPADSLLPNRERRAGPVTTIRLRYAEGPRDAEALLVDPSSEDLVVVTKPLLGEAEVYVKEAPFADGTLVRAGILTDELTGTTVRLVTGADVTRAGDYVALRTYDNVYLFTRTPGQTLAQALLAPPCLLPSPPEKQGEAIALLDRPGRAPAVATVSEGDVTALWIIEPE